MCGQVGQQVDACSRRHEERGGGGGREGNCYLTLTACFWTLFFFFLCRTDFKNLVQHVDVAIDIV